MALTTPTQVLNGYHSAEPITDQDWVSDLIDEAEDVLASKLGDLTVWAGDDAQRLRLLQRVTKRVVRRVLRNPDGFRAEQSGDYSYSRDPRVASGTVWVTDEDWALLGISTRRARTIKLATPVRCTNEPA